MNQLGEISPFRPKTDKNNKNPEINNQKKDNDKEHHSVNSSKLLNLSLEKDDQNLQLKENQIENKNSENNNLLNVQCISSKKIGVRKQTESITNANTKIINESSIVKKDKIGSLLLSQAAGNKNNLISLTKIANNDKEFISQILYQHFLFKYMDNKIISNLTNNFEQEKFESNQIIYEENSVGEKFYIVKEGTVEETSQNNAINKTYRENDTFGDLALIEKGLREGTMKAIDNVILFSLKGNLFRKIVHKINKEEQKERFDFLSIVPIFQFINKMQLNSIVLNMFTCTYEQGNIIFKEGDTGYSLFIIKSGEINCESKTGEIIRILKAKDYFGEYAVLFDIPRSLTVRAKTKIVIYKISTSVLEDSIGSDFRNIILKSILREALLKSKFFSVLGSNYYINEMYLNSEIILFKNDSNVVFENDEKNMIKKCKSNKNMNKLNLEETNDDKILYCIICGNFIIKNHQVNNTIKIVAKRGELYGEDFLNLKSKIHNHKNNVFAEGECRVFKIMLNNIIKIMNIKIKSSKILSVLQHINYMQKTEMFRNTSINKVIQICTLMRKEKFEKDQYIFRKGAIADKFYIIKKGAVIVWHDEKLVRELEEGSCFGELALLSNEPRSATLQAKVDCTLYALEKKDFIRNIDKKLLEYLNIKMSLLDDFNMSLDDFYFCRNLGQGKFGEVSLVHNNKHFYAIKCVDKMEAEKHKHLVKYFLEERRVLQELDHPFIMKLVRTFKTQDNIFFLTNFINGKGLNKYLDSKKSKTFRNKEETRFYISILFVILDYLNSKGIAHRDLKPENIMINTQGYLQLIDFGTAKRIKDFTCTIIGTAYYISPEVLIGKGYSFSCDYWSIGILAFEIYYNYYPFGNEANEPMEVYRDVLKKDLSLPYNGDKSVNSFIKAMLNKKVSQRLSSLEKAKKHEFFKNFNWDDLIDLQMKPPYIPECLELKSFDKYSEKYVTHLKKEKSKYKNDKTVNSYYDEDDTFGFNSNWADEF